MLVWRSFSFLSAAAGAELLDSSKLPTKGLAKSVAQAFGANRKTEDHCVLPDLGELRVETALENQQLLRGTHRLLYRDFWSPDGRGQ
jgi:hypothetical protein